MSRGSTYKTDRFYKCGTKTQILKYALYKCYDNKMRNETIIACPVCNGWGTNKVPLDDNFKECTHCRGESMQLKSKDYILYWDIPGYFDYGGRQKKVLYRLGLVALLILMLLAAIIVVIFLFTYAVSLL